MLIKYEKETITTYCDECGHITDTPSSAYSPKYYGEIGEYNNLMVECSECGCLEVFNMNLDLHEDLTNSGLPERELIQREMVKEMIRDMVVDIVE